MEDAELLEHMESINQRRPGKRVSYFPAVFHDNRCARLGNLSKSSTAAAVGRERKEEAAASRREEPGRSPTSVASLSPLAPSCVTVRVRQAAFDLPNLRMNPKSQFNKRPSELVSFLAWI